MKFLKRILGIKEDPSAEWPELPPCKPAVNLAAMTFGGLRFGAALAEARVFGRPDKATFNEKRAELLYARCGFSLEFEDGALSAVVFLIAREDYSPDHPALAFARPSITLMDGGVSEFADTTTAQTLVERFGKPSEVDNDAEETVVYWTMGKVSVEAELFPTNRLKRLSFWPTQEE